MTVDTDLATNRTACGDSDAKPAAGGRSAQNGPQRRSAASGPAGSVNGRRIPPRELLRRSWHIGPGFLPLLLWPFPHRDPISPTLQVILLATIVCLAVAIYTQYRFIARSALQRNRLPAVAGYAGSVLLMLFLFPAHAELGLTVLAVLAFGDGSATFGGLLFRGPALPWNGEKSWAGLLSFLTVGTPMAALIYWGETHNAEALPPGGVSLATAFICSGCAVAASAVVESLRSRINDNIRVGLAAAVSLIAVQTAVVGW